MRDAIARYRTASEANDIDGVMKTLAPDAEWLALTLFALKLGPKVGRHPGIVRRALRRA